MSKLLTISIPTYNRYGFLKTCLEQLLPQVAAAPAEVEVLITDNCSQDETEAYVRQLANKYPFLKYHRNTENIGYVGNQLNCFLFPETTYTAILCDDDVYLHGAVPTLLNTLRSKTYALVALNYYSFTKNFATPNKTDYAPTGNKLFERAYDIMNYPSVGHYSGLVFHTQQAQQMVQQSLNRHNRDYYENLRGVIFDVALRVTAASTDPAFFIGERILANYQQAELDYNSLKHLCIDYYNYFAALQQEGVITKSDLLYRKGLVQQRLLRNIFSSLSATKKSDMDELWSELKNTGLLDKKLEGKSRLLFAMARRPATHLLMKGVYASYKRLKK